MPRYYLCVDVPDTLDHAFRNGYTGLTAGNPVAQTQRAIVEVLPALESGEHVTVTGPLVLVTGEHGTILDVPPPTTTRSEARTEFLADVMVTAVEGGINDWCQIASWNSADTNNRTEVQVVALAECDNPMDDHGFDLPRKVTVDDLARAFRRIAEGDVRQLADDYRRNISGASAVNDAGELDAYDASIVFQVALFDGTVVYG